MYLRLAQKGKSAVEEEEDVTCAKSQRKSVWEPGAKPGFPSWLPTDIGLPAPPYQCVPQNQVWGRHDSQTRER